MKYQRKKLLKNMQNRFSNGKNRFSKPTFNSSSVNKVNFERGLISKKNKKLNFVNYANNQNEKVYNIVIDYYIRYLENDYSFIDEFEMDELSGGERVDRLLDIINYVQNTKYSRKDCQYILKMKHNEEKPLHFYFRRNKSNLSLILIDLYHLGIYGSLFKNGKEYVISVERIYRRNKNNEIDLTELKKLAKDTTPVG